MLEQQQEDQQKALAHVAQTVFVQPKLQLKDALGSYYAVERIFSQVAIYSKWSLWSNKESDTIKAELRNTIKHAAAQEKIWCAKRGFPWEIDVKRPRNICLAISALFIGGYTACRLGETYIVKPISNQLKILFNRLCDRIRQKNLDNTGVMGDDKKQPQKQDITSGSTRSVSLQRSQ